MVYNILIKTRKSAMLSSMEVAYVILRQGAMELKLLWMLLEEIIYVELPGIQIKDNMGAIFVKDQQVGQRTKHSDICWHYICEPNKRKEVNVEFAHDPKDHNSNVCTKNVPEKVQMAIAFSIQEGKLNNWKH
jgi:hypothetical protein